MSVKVNDAGFGTCHIPLRSLTDDENACVHSTQNRHICFGNSKNCCFTLEIIVFALR